LAAYVQNPELGRSRFDLVAAMPHDGVRGTNVMLVPTALHGVTATTLNEARERWRDRLGATSRPLLGVLVGGDNGNYRLTSSVTDRLLRILRTARRDHGMDVIATPSRRTADATKHQLSQAIASQNLGWLWDETGENPYLAILALAERLIVTVESISMISEALATGRPVHVLPLEGHGKRHDAFLKRIVADRLVSLIEGDDLDFSFKSSGPISSTEAPAARLREMLGLPSEG
jgi:mitochondrial fission protein ELM1